MKRIAAAALALCLMSGASALAQETDQHHDKAAGAPRGAGPTHGGPPGPTAQPVQGSVHQGGPAGPGGNAFHTRGGPAGVVQGNPNNLQTQGGPNGFQAQDRGSRRNGGQPQGNPNSLQTQGGPNGFQPQDRGFRRNGGQPQGNPNNLQTQGGPNGFQTQDRGFHRNGGQPQGVVGQPDGRGDQRAFNGGSGRGLDRGARSSFGAPGFRPGGTRPYYNQQYFPRTFNPGNRFHWREGNWNGPRGFSYRPWFFGQVLPYGWYGSEWYISDYYDYELPVPPYGYEWIRNGPDALLVNIASGLVVSSVPGIFY